ncbi:hypothetical protein ACLUWO_05580 [Pseudoscardovia radai]|uniref:hypothetical protein n=1 Tax=Pseudoscardovia radai TaxID=987066 RepID=UPI0039952C8C
MTRNAKGSAHPRGEKDDRPTQEERAAQTAGPTQAHDPVQARGTSQDGGLEGASDCDAPPHADAAADTGAAATPDAAAAADAGAAPVIGIRDSAHEMKEAGFVVSALRLCAHGSADGADSGAGAAGDGGNPSGRGPQDGGLRPWPDDHDLMDAFRRILACVGRLRRDRPKAPGRVYDNDALAERRRRFHERRSEEGIVATDTAWFRAAVGEWAAALESGRPVLSDDVILDIGAGARETLSIRDALLVSVLAPVGASDMLRVAGDPHDAVSVDIVFESLNGVFRRRSNRPDVFRCLTGLRLYERLAAALPGRDRANAYASTAYVCWWLGLTDEASELSLRARRNDPSCSLAGIIRTAVDFGVVPAWLDYAYDAIAAGGEA